MRRALFTTRAGPVALALALIVPAVAAAQSDGVRWQTTAARPEAAQSTAADRRSVDVTVYNNNLALVREVRDVELPGGLVELAWEDVTAQVRPETVHAKDVVSPIEIVEQNYRYDVLSPGGLAEHYVGREITLAHTVYATGEIVRENATLLSTGNQAAMYGGGYADPGSYVYRTDEDVTFGGWWRIVLPSELPEGFVARPTLFWLLQNVGAGRHSIETSYLTWGMSWKADYVLLLSADGTKGDLAGWVTLTNNSGIGFEDAGLQLVAGQVNVDYGVGYGRGGDMLVARTAMIAADESIARGFAEEGMFEYHLYTLQRDTDLADREQKQIELLSGSGIPVERHYELRSYDYWFVSQQNAIFENLHPSVRLEFVNAEAVRLGMPLPAGTVRVYQVEPPAAPARGRAPAADAGGREFLGEDSIDHTPREERVKLRVGNAFDIVAERRQTDYELLGDGWVETEWEVTLRNRKAETVVVEVREPTSGDWSVMSSSLPYEKVSARELRFDVTCPPDEEVVLRYRLRVKYY